MFISVIRVPIVILIIVFLYFYICHTGSCSNITSRPAARPATAGGPLCLNHTYLYVYMYTCIYVYVHIHMLYTFIT